MSKYKRPDDMPGRVCRVLEAYTMLEMNEEDPFQSMVYRFTHIASGRCPHEGWMAEFVEMEKVMEEEAFTSPAEREAREAETDSKSVQKRKAAQQGRTR